MGENSKNIFIRKRAFQWKDPSIQVEHSVFKEDQKKKFTDKQNY